MPNVMRALGGIEGRLAGLALVSGAAGLVYELVWVRWFAEIFGSTAQAGAAVLAAYFGGLAIGSRWLGSLAPRVERPLLVYAGLEASALVGVLAVPHLLLSWEPLHAALYESADGSRLLLTGAKLLLAVLSVGLPCTALGGTLPILTRALEPDRSPAAAARLANLIYGVNTLGGAAGVVLAALALPRAIGVLGTYLSGAALQMLAICGALWVGRAHRIAGHPPDPSRPKGAASRTECWAAAAAGAGALAVQVFLLRALDQVVVSTFFSAGATLCATLVAIAIAALAATSRRLTLLLPASVIAIGAGLLLAIFPVLFTSELRELAEIGGIERHWKAVYTAARVAALLGLPLLVCASMLLPWLISAAERSVREHRVAFRVGRLLAWNVVGGVAGSLLAGFILLPLFGLWKSTSLVAGAYVVAGCVAGLRDMPVRTAVGAVAVALVLWALQPWQAPRVWLSPDETLVAVYEGAHASVAVVDDEHGRAMRLNNHYTLAGTGLRTDEARRGHLPLLLHPHPRHVVFLGSATGLTAAAALSHPEVRQLDLVEIVPEVADAARDHFGVWNRDVYDAPVTRVRLEDARNHMRLTDERYDVVVGELFVPWNPGASGLFTREHFEAVGKRLADGGLYCQWLPLHQLGQRSFEVIVATYRDVFPDAFLWRGSFHPDLPVAALCSRGPSGAPEAARERMEGLSSLGISDRWLLSPAAFRALAVGPVAGLPLDVPQNTEDRPWIELSSYDDSQLPLVGRRWQQWTREIDYNEAGQVLYDYQVARLEGNEVEVQRLAVRARELLPERLFAPARP